MKHSRFACWSLLLLLLPVSVWADSSTVGDLFRPFAQDKSVLHLTQLLGSVGSVLVGQPGHQLLGSLFRLYNYGLLAVATLIVTYTVFMAIFNTASEGEFMGKEAKAGTVFLRNVVGIGLLVPGAQGYSLVQIFVVWAITQGIGLADNLWAQGFQYTQTNGGFQLISNGNPGITLPDLQSMGNNDSYIKKFVAPTFYANVCTSLVNQQLSNMKTQIIQQLGTSGSLQDKVTAIQLLATTLPQAGMNVVPAAFDGNLSGQPPTLTVQYGFQTGDPQLANLCGQFTLSGAQSTDPTTVSASAASTAQTTNMTLLSAYTSTVSNVSVVSSLVASQLMGNGSAVSNDGVQSALTGGFNSWQALVNPLRTAAIGSSLSSLRSLNNTMITDGWMYAGSYYLQMSSWGSSFVNSLDLSQFMPIASPSYSSQQTPPITYDFSTVSSHLGSLFPTSVTSSATVSGMLGDQEDQFSTQLSSELSQAIANYTPAVNAADDALKQEVQQMLSNQSSNSIGWLSDNTANQAGLYLMLLGVGIPLIVGASLIGEGDGGVLAGGMFAMVLTATIAWDILFAEGGEEDPVVAIMMFGRILATGTILMWLLAAGIVSVMAGFKGMMCSIQPSCEVDAAGRTLLMPAFNAFVTTCLVTGTVMAVYIPMIPYLIYFFATLGWIISVIEAVVAAPLVALGLTHPQGHDFLGKAEQGIMLLLSVFLRPVLIVIGFFASMFFVRIAWQVLKAGITPLAYSILDGANAANLLLVLALFICFTMIVISLVNACFGLIHIVPDKVMQWIGVNTSGYDLGREAIAEAKGGAQAVGGIPGGGMRSLMEGVSANRGQQEAQNRNGMGAKKNTTSTPGNDAPPNPPGGGGDGGGGGGGGGDGQSASQGGQQGTPVATPPPAASD